VKSLSPGGDVALLTSGSVFAQGLALLAAPLVTRLYLPEHFGVLALYVGVLGIAGGAGALKYELAVPLPRSETVAVNVLSLALAVTTVMAMVALLVAALANRIVGAAQPALSAAIWLIPVGMLLTGGYRCLNYWAIRTKRFGAIAKTSVSQAVSSLVTQIGLGIFGAGSMGLIVANMLGQSGGITILATSAWSSVRYSANKVRLRRMNAVARRYRRFACTATFGGVINSGGIYAPALLLVTLYGTAVGGLYALADRITSIPINTLGNAVSQVYYGQAAGAKGSPGELRRLFVGTVIRMAYLAIVPVVIFVWVAPSLFEIVFGATWSEAGRYAQVLALLLCVKFVVHPVSQTLNIIEQQGLLAWWSAARVIAVSAALAIPWVLGADALVAIWSFALTGALAYMILMLITLREIASVRRTVKAGLIVRSESIGGIL
jgi:O-antigen/teichoic acid export membrane protein